MFVACLLVTLSLVRGPLFQRASIVAPYNVTLSGKTSILVVRDIPYHMFITYDNVYTTSGLYTSGVRDHLLNRPIPLPASNCRGECHATIKVSCISPFKPILSSFMAASADVYPSTKTFFNKSRPHNLKRRVKRRVKVGADCRSQRVFANRCHRQQAAGFKQT